MAYRNKKQDYAVIIGGNIDESLTTRKKPRTRRVQWMTGILALCIVLQTARLAPNILSKSRMRTAPLNASTSADPADSFEDNIWPIRQPTQWDISTDFPYPSTIEFDTEEGTWLRLDVHPKSGEIVFDMLGDLYCLPARAYAKLQDSNTQASLEPERAYSFLRGVPYDSDPHFSPDGKTLVFRSDAELGVENIWALEWKGCWNMDIEGFAEVDALNAARRDDLSSAKMHEESDEQLLLSGVKETAERKKRRLIREGRSDCMSLWYCLFGVRIHWTPFSLARHE